MNTSPRSGHARLIIHSSSYTRKANLQERNAYLPFPFFAVLVVVLAALGTGKYRRKGGKGRGGEEEEEGKEGMDGRGEEKDPGGEGDGWGDHPGCCMRPQCFAYRMSSPQAPDSGPARPPCAQVKKTSSTQNTSTTMQKK